MTDDNIKVTTKQIPQAPANTPEDIERLVGAKRLEEVDFLKVRLLSRNLELMETQAENIQLRQQNAMNVLQEFGAMLKVRYSLREVGQVDPNTGEINRELPTEGTRDVE